MCNLCTCSPAHVRSERARLIIIIIIIIIIIVWFLIGKTLVEEELFRLVLKTSSTVQYGHRKCATYARLFSQTLAHGNRKNEKRKDTE